MYACMNECTLQLSSSKLRQGDIAQSFMVTDYDFMGQSEKKKLLPSHILLVSLLYPFYRTYFTNLSINYSSSLGHPCDGRSSRKRWQPWQQCPQNTTAAAYNPILLGQSWTQRRGQATKKKPEHTEQRREREKDRAVVANWQTWDRAAPNVK